MYGQFDARQLAHHGTCARHRLDHGAAGNIAAIRPHANDPTRLDFDPLGLGQLVQFNPALTRAARIAPNHRIMTGRCAIGVPQACQNGKARIFSKV